MSDASALCRYAETGDSFQFATYPISVDHDVPDTLPERLAGAVSDAPAWLSEIIAMAKVGGWVMKVPQPPPDLVLWFEVDANLNLIRYSILIADTN